MRKLIGRIKKIKLILFDVDGVMTDARIFLDSSGNWKRLFNVRDGVGIVLAREAGYQTGIITGANSVDVRARVEHLKIDHFFEKQLDKGPAYNKIKELTGYGDEEISYIGDDIFDISLLKCVGFAATVPGVVEAVAESAHYQTTRSGGDGAVREYCDLILEHGYYSS